MILTCAISPSVHLEFIRGPLGYITDFRVGKRKSDSGLIGNGLARLLYQRGGWAIK